jgi:hypothetical protein
MPFAGSPELLCRPWANRPGTILLVPVPRGPARALLVPGHPPVSPLPIARFPLRSLERPRPVHLVRQSLERSQRSPESLRGARRNGPAFSVGRRLWLLGIRPATSRRARLPAVILPTTTCPRRTLGFTTAWWCSITRSTSLHRRHRTAARRLAVPRNRPAPGRVLAGTPGRPSPSPALPRLHSRGSPRRFPSSSLDEAGFRQGRPIRPGYIRAGDVYQVNLAHRLEVTGPVRVGTVPAFARGLPGALCGVPRGGDFQLASSSPELFLRFSGRHVTTRPIKGTRPRSVDPVRDAQLAYELQTSPKELAELLMITDLLRNDLGRICDYGSITVPDLARLERSRKSNTSSPPSRADSDPSSAISRPSPNVSPAVPSPARRRSAPWKSSTNWNRWAAALTRAPSATSVSTAKASSASHSNRGGRRRPSLLPHRRRHRRRFLAGSRICGDPGQSRRVPPCGFLPPPPGNSRGYRPPGTATLPATASHDPRRLRLIRFRSFISANNSCPPGRRQSRSSTAAALRRWFVRNHAVRDSRPLRWHLHLDRLRKERISSASVAAIRRPFAPPRCN